MKKFSIDFSYCYILVLSETIEDRVHAAGLRFRSEQPGTFRASVQRMKNLRNKPSYMVISEFRNTVWDNILVDMIEDNFTTVTNRWLV